MVEQLAAAEPADIAAVYGIEPKLLNLYTNGSAFLLIRH